MLCFCIVTWRGARVALRAPDAFGAYPRARADDDDRGAGVHQHQRRARADADQRIPLPLVSFGGSSLLINLVGMGILLNVSQHTTPSAA